MPRTAPEFTIEYMTSMDAAEVVKLDEKACTYWDEDFERELVHTHCWTEDEVKAFIKESHTVGLVLRDAKDNLRGFVAYEMNAKAFHIVGLVVHPNHRRKGYGTALLGKVYEKLLAQTQHKTILVHVREGDRPSQEFFKKHGFQSRVRRNYFLDDSDAYRFVWTKGSNPLDLDDNEG